MTGAVGSEATGCGTVDADGAGGVTATVFSALTRAGAKAGASTTAVLEVPDGRAATALAEDRVCDAVGRAAAAGEVDVRVGFLTDFFDVLGRLPVLPSVGGFETLPPV